MCGRTACTLAPDDVCRACGTKTKQGKWQQPKWKSPPGGQKYYTSYNVTPGSHTPVLLSKSHFDSKTTETSEMAKMPKETTEEAMDLNSAELESDWVVQPMHWGLVPCWNQTDSKSVGYNMINARSESMLTKRSFKGPLEKGRRCVVLVDGYFEWQTAKDGTKQPYFLYFPHAASETVDNLSKEAESRQDQIVYSDKRLLTLAGLFDVWKPKNGDPPLYSYSIITVDAHKHLSWLHDRMPAVLDGEEEVRAWLDSGSVPLLKALDLIKPRSSVQYHPVSSSVGSVKNKTEECIKPIDLEKEKRRKAGGSVSVMMSWLNKGKKRTSEEMATSEASKDTPESVGENDRSEKGKSADTAAESPTKKHKLDEDGNQTMP